MRGGGGGPHLLIVFETTFVTVRSNFEIVNALFPVNLAATLTRFATDFHLVPGDRLQLPRQCLPRFRHGSSVIPAFSEAELRHNDIVPIHTWLP